MGAAGRADRGWDDYRPPRVGDAAGRPINVEAARRSEPSVPAGHWGRPARRLWREYAAR